MFSNINAIALGGRIGEGQARLSHPAILLLKIPLRGRASRRSLSQPVNGRSPGGGAKGVKWWAILDLNQ